MKTTIALRLVLVLTWLTSAPVVSTLVIRGHPQQLRLYGDARREPAIVASGDGGWIHLAPHVASLLERHGFYVVGFDTRAYLSSFTERDRTLRAEDVPQDVASLVSMASAESHTAPILVGVSEGAGLAVLAATAPALKSRIRGVITLGLGDRNELAWRWQDSVIYLTKEVPNEPTFSAAEVIPRVAPTPLVLLRSRRDEYVGDEEADRLARLAREPKRVWTIDAADHRFSNNLPEFDARLLEAVAWIREEAARTRQ